NHVPAGQDSHIRADVKTGPGETVTFRHHVDGAVDEAHFAPIEAFEGPQGSVGMGDHGIGEVVFLEGDAGHAGEDASNLAGVAEPAALGIPYLSVLEDVVRIAG